jgi:hypothetical protein
MDGIFINGRRPKSKKEIKEAIAADPASVELECTSVFENDYNYTGPLDEAPVGRYSFVGPDPYRARNFYGTIIVTPEEVKCS